MKNIYLLLLCALCALYSNTAAAYGNDVIINNTPGISHSKVEIDVAYNGWIFAAYSFVDGIDGGICIRRSKDDGQTWQTIDNYTVNNVRYPVLDITVSGTDTNDLRLFVIGVNHNINTNTHIIFVDKYDAATGVYDISIFNHNTGSRTVYDVASATDYKFPAVGASPYSVAFAYSCDGVVADSLNFVISLDAGSTAQTSRNVATSSRRLGKIDIDYGRSESASNGRYFVAWEEFESPAAYTGHIYTARHSSTVAGVFTPAVNLDSISTTMINLCRNPRIALSQSTDDNDSGAVTAVVLVERDYLASGDYDVLGFYNKRAHFTNYWYRMDIDNDGSSDMQPDISYDTVSKNFMVTYLDSTNGILPYKVNDWNLIAANAWANISAQYNDVAANMRNAYPRIAVNPAQGSAVHAWVQEDGSGRGIALFDAQGRQTAITNLTEVTCINVPFNFNGQLLDTSGVYSDTIATAGGDSVVILTLTVNPYETKSVSESICAGDVYTFNGQALSVPGTYYDTLSASTGCDTIVTLNLSVNIVVTPVITQAGATLSVQAYSSYQWILNGTDIPLANGQTHAAASNGVYTVRVTDATGCSATSAPVTVNGVGINKMLDSGISVFPNPVSDAINIELASSDKASLRITDVNGSVVMEGTINAKTSINVQHLPQGIYMLHITQSGKTAAAKIVKQ